MKILAALLLLTGTLALAQDAPLTPPQITQQKYRLMLAQRDEQIELQSEYIDQLTAKIAALQSELKVLKANPQLEIDQNKK